MRAITLSVRSLAVAMLVLAPTAAFAQARAGAPAPAVHAPAVAAPKPPMSPMKAAAIGAVAVVGVATFAHPVARVVDIEAHAVNVAVNGPVMRQPVFVGPGGQRFVTPGYVVAPRGYYGGYGR